jgi:hypothetical protein
VAWLRHSDPPFGNPSPGSHRSLEHHWDSLPRTRITALARSVIPCGTQVMMMRNHARPEGRVVKRTRPTTEGFHRHSPALESIAASTSTPSRSILDTMIFDEQQSNDSTPLHTRKSRGLRRGVPVRGEKRQQIGRCRLVRLSRGGSFFPFDSGHHV